jgi:hypothetical protein
MGNGCESTADKAFGRDRLMDIDDYVWVIKKDDTLYGHKCRIAAIQTDFDRHITGYTLNDRGVYRDYAPEDVEYTTARRRHMSGQMQLF